MSVNLTVNGDVYEYPSNRQAPGWGEDSSAWAVAVTDVLANVVGQGDILQTSATIANTGTSVAISGFSFDPALVRASICEYSIYRKTDTAGDERVEAGTIYITFKTVAGTWDITVVGSGGSGISLSINSSGQVLYTVSEVLGGANYSGTMKFRARSLTI